MQKGIHCPGFGERDREMHSGCALAANANHTHCISTVHKFPSGKWRKTRKLIIRPESASL